MTTDKAYLDLRSDVVRGSSKPSGFAMKHQQAGKPRQIMDMCKMDGSTGYAEFTQKIRDKVETAKVLNEQQYEEKLSSFDQTDLMATFDHLTILKTRKDVPRLLQLLRSTPFEDVRVSILKVKDIYRVELDADVQFFYSTVVERCNTWQRNRAIKNIGKFGSTRLSEYFKDQYSRHYDNSGHWSHPPHMYSSFEEDFEEMLPDLQEASKNGLVDNFFDFRKNDELILHEIVQATKKKNYQYFKRMEVEIPKDCNSPRWYIYALSRPRVVKSIARGSSNAQSSLDFQRVLDTVNINLWTSVFVGNYKIWSRHLNQEKRLRILRHPRFKDKKEQYIRGGGLFHRLPPQFRKAVFIALLDIGKLDDYRKGFKIEQDHLYALTLDERQDFKDMFLHSVNELANDEPRFIAPNRDVLRIHIFEPSIEELFKLANTQQDRDERLKVIRECQRSVTSQESLTALLKLFTTRWKNEIGSVRSVLITNIRLVPLEYWHDDHAQYVLEIYDNEQNSRDSCSHSQVTQLIAKVMTSSAAFDEMFAKFSFLWTSIRSHFVSNYNYEAAKAGTLSLTKDQIDRVFKLVVSLYMPDIIGAVSVKDLQEKLTASEVLKLSKALLGSEAKALEKLDTLKQKIKSYSSAEDEFELLDLYHTLGLDLPYPKSLELILQKRNSNCANIIDELKSSFRYPSTAFVTHIKSIVQGDVNMDRLRSNVGGLERRSFTHWSPEFQHWYIDNVASKVSEAFFLPVFTISNYHEKLEQAVTDAVKKANLTGRATNDDKSWVLIVDGEAAATRRAEMEPWIDIVSVEAAQSIPYIHNKTGFETLLVQRVRSKDANSAIPIYIHLLKHGPAGNATNSITNMLNLKEFGVSVRKQLLRALAAVSSVDSFVNFIAEYAAAGCISQRDVKDAILDELSLQASKKTFTIELYQTWEQVFLIDVQNWSWRSNYSETVAKTLGPHQQSLYIRLFLDLHIKEDMSHEVKDDHKIWDQRTFLLRSFPERIPLDLVEKVDQRVQVLLAAQAKTNAQKKQLQAGLEILKAYTFESSTDDSWVEKFCNYVEALYPGSALVESKEDLLKHDIFRTILNPFIAEYNVKISSEVTTPRDISILSKLDTIFWSSDRSLPALYRSFTLKLQLSILNYKHKLPRESTDLAKVESIRHLLALRTRIAKLVNAESGPAKQAFDTYFIKIALENHFLGSVNDAWPTILTELQEEFCMKTHFLCFMIQQWAPHGERDNGRWARGVESAWWEINSMIATHENEVLLILVEKGLLK